MATAPKFLNDDGTASMATAFLTSHHGLRRDLRRFARSLAAPDVASHAEALREEWKSYHATLHGHHTAEDTTMFPNMKNMHPQLAATIDKLTADPRAAPEREDVSPRGISPAPALRRVAR